MLAPHDEEEEEDIFGLIKAGDTQGVCQLLDADDELLDSRDDNQWTPLMVAAIQGRADVFEALMQRGPDLEAITALMLATRWSLVVVVVSLLERMHGTGIDWRDGEGKTALYWACERGCWEWAAVLLHGGADHPHPSTYPSTHVYL